MIGDPKTSIVNDALMLVGGEPVPDLSDPSLAQSIAAVKLLRQIERSREVVLARHGWTCALTYVSLVPATIPNYLAPPDYPTVFLLPPDALRLWMVNGQTTTSAAYQGWEPRWQVGTTEVAGAPQLILRAAQPVYDAGMDGSGFGYQFGLGWSAAPSSGSGVGSSAPGGVGQVNIAYVRRADWGSLDAHVANAVSAELGARCAYSINGDNGLANSLRKQAENAVQMALGAESAQEGGQPADAGSIPAALRAVAR